MTKQTTFKIKGYTIYVANHPNNKARGGSAIIIRNNLKHFEKYHLQSEEVQISVVCVTSIKQNINIGAIYYPPRHNLKRADYKNHLLHMGERCILGGDFNAKHTDWGSRIVTTKGKELREAMRELGCEYYSTCKPTYWPTDRDKIPDLLDFFVSRKVSPNFINIEENFDLNSDHSAVILTLSENIIRKENKPTLVNKSTGWESFRLELERTTNLEVQLKTPQHIEEEAEKFTKLVQRAAWNNTKEIKRRTVGINYPAEIKQLVGEKRKARRRWQQTRDPKDKTVQNRRTTNLKREIQKWKEESVQYYLVNLTNEKETEFSLWKATKKLKRPLSQIPPIKKTNWGVGIHE